MRVAPKSRARRSGGALCRGSPGAGTLHPVTSAGRGTAPCLLPLQVLRQEVSRPLPPGTNDLAVALTRMRGPSVQAPSASSRPFEDSSGGPRSPHSQSPPSPPLPVLTAPASVLRAPGTNQVAPTQPGTALCLPQTPRLLPQPPAPVSRREKRHRPLWPQSPRVQAAVPPCSDLCPRPPPCLPDAAHILGARGGNRRSDWGPRAGLEVPSF